MNDSMEIVDERLDKPLKAAAPIARPVDQSLKAAAPQKNFFDGFNGTSFVQVLEDLKNSGQDPYKNKYQKNVNIFKPQ